MLMPTHWLPAPTQKAVVGALTSFLLAESLGGHVLFLVINKDFVSLSIL